MLGSDFAGVVVESKSNSVKIGDRVCGMVSGTHSPNQGAFAEYVATSADLCVKIPDMMSFNNASTLGMSLYTAIQALFLKSHLALDPNHTQTVLIWGASTSVGMYAVQLAHLKGMNVAATTSTNHNGVITKLGAKFVFDYTDVEVVNKLKQDTNDNITSALDCVGNRDSLKNTVAAVTDAQPAAVHTVLPPPDDLPVFKTTTRVEFSLVHSIFAQDLTWANYLFERTITQAEMEDERNEVTEWFNYDKGIVYELLSNDLLKTIPVVATSNGLENVLPWLLKMEKGEIRGGKVIHILKE